MTLSSTTVMPHNMPHMSGNFYTDVSRKRSLLTSISASFVSPQLPSQDSNLLLQATKYVDHTIIDAISKFPTPANRTDLRSFFGLVNQLSASTNTISTLLTPLRPLLSTKNDFQWSDTHDQAFHTVKASLTVAPMLSFFNMNKPTRLCTDASRQGLGFVLQQRDTSGTWTLVQAGSRFLTDAESRYAIIELEMLAVAWATLKCHLFLAGLQHFQVVTDHNPLVPILNHHRLDEIENPRLQRLKIKLMAYNFTTEWVKGTKNGAPDALSRNPVTDPSLETPLRNWTFSVSQT